MLDQEIIQKIKENKLGKVYKHLHKAYPSVKKWIINNSGSKQDAEDAFQEALLVLCINCKKDNFKLSSNVATYLIAIAKNIWFANLRKKGKQLDNSIIEIETIEIDQTISEEKFTLAEQAFNLLGEKCRLLLEKFYILKLSFEKISKELGFTSPEIAKNQKYRCLQKAKELYKQLNEEGGLPC